MRVISRREREWVWLREDRSQGGVEKIKKGNSPRDGSSGEIVLGVPGHSPPAQMIAA